MKRVDDDELDFSGSPVLHEGELFTGVAYENWPDGTVRVERHFEDGFPHGPYRTYSESGKLLEEQLYGKGALHGLTRWWDEQGRLRGERLVQFGTVMSRKSYDENGDVIDEYHIDEGSYDATRVRKRLSEKAEKEKVEAQKPK